MNRNPFVTFVMVLLGIILLLPGLCAIVFMGSVGSGDSAILLLWLVCFGISAGRGGINRQRHPWPAAELVPQGVPQVGDPARTAAPHPLWLRHCAHGPRRSGTTAAGACVALSALASLPGLIAMMFGGYGGVPSDPYFWLVMAGWAIFWLICIAIGYLGLKLMIRPLR